VYIQDVSKTLVEKEALSVNNGAYVSEVVEKSPAEKAGIKEGDVIVKFNDTDIDDADALSNAVRKKKADSEASIEVVRGNDTKTFAVKLGEFSSTEEMNDADEEENNDQKRSEIFIENAAPHALFSLTGQNEFDGISVLELN
jgi:C-terminal processing protease CtpA/Prc